SIEITTAPKTNYLVGEDFSAANGIITLTYNNGDKETINLSDATISGYDKTKIGEQTLKIEYQGVETTLTTPVSFIPGTQTDVKVWSFNSTIYLETLPDTKYTIIDLNGRTIKSATTKSTKEEINLPKSGVLIVLIGNTAYKVAN
ncbi:MAG: bacterial Ig-like domain-containing protein, partial [Bacteroidales bacterium]|nr:bacterial Ig-like domain-containing protein [Bacteroidales bacterium]